MSDPASKLLEQIGFNPDENKRIVKMVEDVYSSLLFRKLTYLMPLKKEDRSGKRIEFLKKDIDNHRLFMIYCYNQFVKDSDNHVFTVPIDDAILKKDKVYKKIIISDPPLSEEDQIEILQSKTNRSFPVTRILYNDMMSKIEKTCEKILDNVGDKIASDPAKLATIMHFVIDTVHVAETEAIDLMDAGSQGNGDPCDANKHFGVDWSFLGIFDALPKDCVEKVDSTKISIVGPVTLVGGKSRKQGSKRSKRQLRTSKKCA
jgi:hypothetical protein